MKLGVCTLFAMAFWKFFTGLRSFPCAITVRPPCWGGTWLFDHHGFLLTVDIYGDDSVHGGPLDKLI